jgi:hypothetical protein
MVSALAVCSGLVQNSDEADIILMISLGCFPQSALSLFTVILLKLRGEGIKLLTLRSNWVPPYIE